MAATTTDEMEFDLSQLDDTLISDQQKQTLINYINQIQNDKHAINENFNQLKLSTGSSERLNGLRRSSYFAMRTNEWMIFSFCSFFSVSFCSSSYSISVDQWISLILQLFRSKQTTTYETRWTKYAFSNHARNIDLYRAWNQSWTSKTYNNTQPISSTNESKWILFESIESKYWNILWTILRKKKKNDFEQQNIISNNSCRINNNNKMTSSQLL